MSGLRSFGGEFRKAQKVSLVGRSRGEETRAEVLERTRRERERRRRERQEQSAATAIQAAWRGWIERQHRQAEVRAAWQARYGAEAERASSMDLAPASGFLRQLCFFAKPAAAGDLRLLAVACRLVLTSQQAQLAPAAGEAPQPPQLLFCAQAAGGGEQAATAIWQAQRLHPGIEAALAGAGLLGNLLDGAAAALKADEAQQLAAVRQPALQFAALACSLLALLPQQPFFPSSDGDGGPQVGSTGGSRWADDDEDEEVQAAVRTVAAAAAPTAAKLPWDAEQLPSASLVAQLQLVADSRLLRSLVRAVLPQADAGSGGALQGPALVQRAADVRRLCGLLQQLMALPGQRQRLLVVLAFSAELVQRLWFSYLRPAQASPVEGWVPSADAACDPGWMLPLTLFSLAYSSFIMTAGDDELYTAQRPLPLEQLHSPDRPGGGVLALLKMALWHALWAEAPPAPGGWSPEAAALRSQLKEAAGKLMGQLHDRNCRRAFAPAEAFQADALPAERFQSEVQAATAAGRGLDEEGAGRAWGLLAHAPYLVPFRERAKLFQAVVAQERTRYRDMDLMQSFAAEMGAGGGNRFFPVRRTQVLQDAYDQLNGLGEGLHGRIRIQFIDAHGLEEAGVDGGGIFKEFVETVVREGFNPEAGLFKATTDNRLYPNPHAQLVAANALRLIEFLGRMLGKAMYEGILVELPLAPFFLKKFRGAYCDINDLPTLDPELYRNLVFLKRYTGDVAELGLTFTITDNVLGVAREVELAPRGHDTPVTADNRLAYIHRVADYRLNRQIREPAAAFLRGLHDLIKPEWVRMFNEEELQMLISGGQQGLDIADMRAHVQYSGGYHEEHPVILEFWRALATFSPQEQADFLRFVTSCPRPPLLGFRYLEPPLAIQLAGSMLDEQATERLPTAATCMNVLKLPPYRTAQQIREKLLYAIQSGAGFELS
ncbi:E3 ubiquitin- ligase UPL6 [Chlorella sorokiniana]|uniref:HECT-type E3 ubiquitin transferase n=1 Tax=Chlorella sorokiniana TaxID=3076 RepID=A0A2P6TL84_CHLSO|nr:E3 ubiquitin- ligase UPL6 [Chlorella sorokiniana]|eukprot:PRW45057.1 E3 ubiquitin- ligase UPL6 [Chlorella sorokiniana]